jgi:hypothetical protein
MTEQPATALISGFKGLNNRLDPTALGPEWQVQADNALCDDARYLVRRPGYTAFLASMSDVFATRDERMFAVTQAGALYEVYADASYRQRATGFVGGPFKWAELGYATFALSDTAAWCIYPDRVVAWGISALPAPSVGVTAGTFEAGTYQIAVVLVAQDGRIGGSVGVATLALDGSQGIVAHSPPVAGYSTRLYLSRSDGTDLYQAATLPGDGLMTVSAPMSEGPRLETLHVYPPPLGGVIASHGNMMCVGVWEPQFDRSVLYWSKPDAPHWFEYEADYQLIAGRVTLLADVAGGLLIGSDRAIYFQQPGAFAQMLAGFGAVPDTVQHLDTGQVAFWTDRGLATYPPLGLPSDAGIIPDNRTLASGAVLDHAGSSYYICAQRGERRIEPIKPYSPLAVAVT